MPKVSIIIPTRNEEQNINRLLLALMPLRERGYDYESVVVDDSDDATAVIAESLGARVVVGQRKGLGQAIIDGIDGSSGDIVVVMDADLSHNPKAIPNLLKPILEQGCDLVIGSRYVKGGDYSNWALNRKIKSIIGVKLMQLVTGVTDSNSGFFAFRKSILDGVKLKADSWKIMLEVFFRGNWLYKKEVPIVFRDRFAGVSKNNAGERLRHAWHMLKLVTYKWGRFINFALVGGIGAIWYFSLLYVLTEYAHIWYGFSAIIATGVAITNNYFINHYYTFRHIKQHNKSLFRGWLKYIANSAVGDGADWLVLVFLTEVFGLWYMVSAFLASGVACIIKYFIASKWIWGKKGKCSTDCDYEWYSYFKGLPWQKYWKHKIANAVVKLSGTAGRVLDVGCGASPQGLMVDHTDYVGVDIDKGKIDYMRGKGLKGALYQVGNMIGIPYKDKVFDTVLCVETIEHARDWQKATRAIGELARLTKDGGTVIIATPNYGSFLGRFQDKLYGIFQPNAYAEDHRVKFNFGTLLRICNRYQLLYEADITPFDMDMVVKFRKMPL